MRRWIPLLALTATACSGTTFRPLVRERGGVETPFAQVFSVDFAVSCDSCRVEYGVEGSTRRDAAQGGWNGSVPLGYLRQGQRARVLLIARPIGGATVLSAEISAGGRTVASRSSDEPGQVLTVRARVGPS